MEVPQVVCLSSKQFESRMRSNLNELQVVKDFCDVTIACEDQQIGAHKVVLSGGSLLFNNLLKQNPHHHPFIFLRGINFSFLSKILDFLYQGEVYIDKNDLDDFLTVAKELKINGLTEHSKQSKHFVEEVTKKKRPRLTNSPEQDLNLDDNEICPIVNDYVSEPITESSVNSDDTDIEKVILPDQLVAETPLTLLSSDQKVKGKLRIRDIAKLTKNPLQIKSCLIEQETSKNDFTCEQCNKNYGNKYFLKSHIDSVHGNGSDQDLKINGPAKDAVGDSNESEEGSKKKSQRLFGIGKNLCLEVKVDDFGSEPITQSVVDFGDNNENANVEKVSLPDQLMVEKHLKVDIRKLRMKDIEKLTKNPLKIQSCLMEKDISKKYFPCEQCNKSYSSKGSLQRHIGADHNGVLHSCEECDCEQCNKSFSSKYFLKSHIDSVHNGNDFTCEQCNKNYASKHILQRHIDAIHKGVLHFCEECCFKSKCKDSLKSHIYSAHTDNGVLYPCDKCKYTTKWKNALQIHINSVHNDNIVSYSCKKCEYTTKWKRNLKFHIDSAHNGDYTATEEEQLRIEILSIPNGNHSGYEGVLYSCELCDHKATKKIDLKRHIKSSHKGSIESVSVSN